MNAEHELHSEQAISLSPAPEQPFGDGQRVRANSIGRSPMNAIVGVPVRIGSVGGDGSGLGTERRGMALADDVAADAELVQEAAGTLRWHSATQRIAELEQTVLALRRQVIEVQEDERQRIARDLHDEAGHALTAVVLRLDLEMMRLASDSPAIETLRCVRQQLVECNAVLHSIAFNLRPRILEDLGLHAALRSLASHTMALSDLEATVAIRGDIWTLDESEELVVLRVVQEALTNVRKHVRATWVRIALDYEPDGLRLQIEDDGVGVGSRAAVKRPTRERAALGIAGMRERVELAGGWFSIGRGPTGGTRIVARLPR